MHVFYQSIAQKNISINYNKHSFYISKHICLYIYIYIYICIYNKYLFIIFSNTKTHWDNEEYFYIRKISRVLNYPLNIFTGKYHKYNYPLADFDDKSWQFHVIFYITFYINK